MHKARLIIMLLAASMSLTACGWSNSRNSSYSASYAASDIELADSHNSFAFDMGNNSINELKGTVSMDSVMTENAMSESYSEGSESSFSNSGATNLASVTSDEVEIAKENKKIIRTVDMTIKIPSSEQLNYTVTGIISLAEQYNGWSAMNKTDFESNYASGQLVLKVPQENTDAFLESLEADGLRITTINDNSQDVTTQYADTETQLRIKQIEKEKYIQYLEEARNIEEILAIEDRLDDVINEIESYTSKLKTLDSQITYTSIGIRINCETSINAESTPEIIKARLSRIGKNALNRILDGVDFLVEAIIGLLFTLPVVLCVIYIGIKVIKRAIFGKELKKLEKHKKRSKGKESKSLIDGEQLKEKEVNFIDEVNGNKDNSGISYKNKKSDESK